MFRCRYATRNFITATTQVWHSWTVSLVSLVFFSFYYSWVSGPFSYQLSVPQIPSFL